MYLLVSLLISVFILVILFYLFTFKSNIINVLIALIGIIPFFGPAAAFITLIVMSIISVAAVSEWEVGQTSFCIRDTQISRWLFNTTFNEMFIK